MAGLTNNTERFLFKDDPLQYILQLLTVFRRADKNDDGAISWDEFRSYFADGVLTTEELQKLFDDIDTHNTNNIDVEELCTYFSQHLGPFDELLQRIEGLSLSVSKALNKSAETYNKAEFVEQYLTRFLLREILGQLSAVQQPIDAASDALEEQAVELRRNISQASEAMPRSASSNSIVPGRIGRHMRRQISSQTSWTPDMGSGTGSLGHQVDRLKTLLDRLENKVTLTGGSEEELNVGDEKMLVLVYRKLCIQEAMARSFRNNMKPYIEALVPENGCLHVSIRSKAGSNIFTIYEIWQDEDQWKSFLKSSECKAFQHSKVDCLELPEQVSHLPIPESWWIVS